MPSSARKTRKSTTPPLTPPLVASGVAQRHNRRSFRFHNGLTRTESHTLSLHDALPILEDFYEQIQKIKKMGSLTDLVGMIPGADKAVKDADLSEASFKPIEAKIGRAHV